MQQHRTARNQSSKQATTIPHPSEHNHDSVKICKLQTANDTLPSDYVGGALPGGFRSSFCEQRYQLPEGGDPLPILQEKALAFLGSTKHVDELITLEHASANLLSGLYRLRNSGSDNPILTRKQYYQDEIARAETIDIVASVGHLISELRRNGTLVAVVEKQRDTFVSTKYVRCFVHVDRVNGLGTFLDVKADTAEKLSTFLEELAIDPAFRVNQAYHALKTERAASQPKRAQAQLRLWRLHERFADYIIGVVSGTLTPLGFLTTTIASGGSQNAMILALLTAGLCDGLSDSVAASQTTQSDSRAQTWNQAKLFLKTMTGKAIIPATFIPIVLLGQTGITTTALAALWAATLLAGTAAIQALAHERAVLPSIAKLLGWGAGALTLGSVVGALVGA